MNDPKKVKHQIYVCCLNTDATPEQKIGFLNEYKENYNKAMDEKIASTTDEAEKTQLLKNKEEVNDFIDKELAKLE